MGSEMCIRDSVNVARYAYDPGSGDVEVSVSLASDGCGARVVLRDGGDIA